ncbi:MAG: adenosylmethionine--8-amino-7-oxononanoate transaminase [Pseudomonadota bacterium]|nr:adenosylmethionine--8-amino-7-oxononanoate transaminase [Pseudomonadota bacterium]
MTHLRSEQLRRRDLAHLWHPCTQMKDHETLPLIPIKSGKGVWLEDVDGNRYIDAVSSWWVNLFGHANPYINDRIKAQLDQLEHVILAGFTHEPVIELSERLAKITPDGLNRCFYADNGSSAVEVALKMSFHFWQNQGKTQKTQFMTLANSYHGETLATLSVGDVALYKATYKPLLMTSIVAPSPDCYQREDGQSWKDYSLSQTEPLRELFEQHHETVCAIIVEPLVQCAGSMRMYHPAYLTELRRLCDEFDIQLIADEIAVGFGRTGTLFACEQAHITPDYMCLSKGLTGGYLPLSVVMTTDKVYEAFYDDYEKLNGFLHSHSYTGNPLACSAALATLDLFEQNDTINANQTLINTFNSLTAPLQDHPHVAEVRQTGMICAIEMVKDKASKTPFAWQERRGLRVFEHGLKNQALLRPLGNVVYFMPPYVITPEQIEHLVSVASRGIDLATT